MGDRFPPIQPAISPAGHASRLSAAEPYASLPKTRRIGVTIACDACRRRKIRVSPCRSPTPYFYFSASRQITDTPGQCDGGRPVCTACDGQVNHCTYRSDSGLGKHATRAVLDVVRLLTSQSEADATRILYSLRNESNADTILQVLNNEVNATPSQHLHRMSTLGDHKNLYQDDPELQAQNPIAYPHLPSLDVSNLVDDDAVSELATSLNTASLPELYIHPSAINR